MIKVIIPFAENITSDNTRKHKNSKNYRAIIFTTSYYHALSMVMFFKCTRDYKLPTILKLMYE